jgi:hypothetical protein
LVLKSPNTVLANCLTDAIDLIQPRLRFSKAKKVVFSVGTQINGVPHIGTYLVQAASFVLAREVAQKFGVQTVVEFTALDNAPYEVVPTTHGEYQRMFGQVLSNAELTMMLSEHYISYFNLLQEMTGVSYSWKTYTQQQAQPDFREMFLRCLLHREDLRWCIAPSNGVLRVRLPCPTCGYSQKQAWNTKLIYLDESSATFECQCYVHGRYKVHLTAEEETYLDINTIFRNIVKEAIYSNDTATLPVMIKGGDWCFSTQPIDWGLGILGLNASQIPMRWFSPQIVTSTGAKLSKSLVRANDASMNETPRWLLDMGAFRERYADTYVHRMIWLMEQFLSHPRHMYRSYSYEEIVRLMEMEYGARNT